MILERLEETPWHAVAIGLGFGYEDTLLAKYDDFVLSPVNK